MRLACVKCQRFFKIKRNGAVLEEGMPVGKPEVWKPYKLYMADLYECEKCGTQLAICAPRPAYEHFQEEYEVAKTAYRAANRLLPMVEDC